MNLTTSHSTKTRWLIIFGTTLSIVLLTIVLIRLDWHAFLTALQTVKFWPILLVTFLIPVSVVFRAFRWNVVADQPFSDFKYFWQAANIGYLGNLIYPARAGELLKMIAIHHFIQLVPGRVITSVVIDRMLDLIMAGIFTLIVIWIHGQKIAPVIGTSVMIVLLVTTLILSVFLFWVDQLQAAAQRFPVSSRWQRLQEWYRHALEGVQAVRKIHKLFIILPLNLFIFCLDYYMIWQLMFAFQWSLPFEAALTTGVFIVIGISLPSAPAYIGIYQIACVLGLGLYNIPESHAVAYSIVLQLLTFGIIGGQGMLVTLYCGFKLPQEDQSVWRFWR